MVTIITKFQAKDMRSAAKLEDIFQKLIEETLEESGYIAYEVFTANNIPFTYYIIEKWASEKDLQNHAELVATKGYAAAAAGLLKNELNNIILQNLNH
ncbi:putative quinol monooxygenase [Pedobacter sp. CFBP9032]|uniref:putative quinol monooxygenase n=1 Tax=Pedobacter sp. CFBP9032 TaxID=3096539 RepID=UPI002A6AF17D|nr:antibiotic biosynthesis monooxygenase [Pedobacter sp. CFBP9032]MDY0905457.1 antibiotic biosynthesis monooxygenase [Pedobacter sp. CFBP9032]